MFVSNELKTHLESSSTIQLQSLVLAEWNMNMPDNISKIGNYRYRSQEIDSQFLTLPNTFDNLDTGLYYTGATDADVTIDGGFKNDGTPQVFTSLKEKNKLIYSLEDCIKPFRPRSGINKAAFFKGKYLSNSGANLARRPRYYMPARDDQFKYWTSYRTENNIERGIAKIPVNGNYYIDDAVPFVVYKDSVPANRLIVKMQTHVGDINLGPFTDKTKDFEDMLLNIKKYIKPEDKILYIHTKGITKPDSKPVKDWRDLMEYFCIKKSIDCIKLLNFHMVVGCKFQGYPKPHFSGNFWWCRGDYYLTLSDEIDDDYFAPEFYICSKLTNIRQIYSFHNTDVQLYCERYPLSKYKR